MLTISEQNFYRYMEVSASNLLESIDSEGCKTLAKHIYNEVSSLLYSYKYYFCQSKYFPETQRKNAATIEWLRKQIMYYDERIRAFYTPWFTDTVNLLPDEFWEILGKAEDLIFQCNQELVS